MGIRGQRQKREGKKGREERNKYPWVLKKGIRSQRLASLEKREENCYCKKESRKETPAASYVWHRIGRYLF